MRSPHRRRVLVAVVAAATVAVLLPASDLSAAAATVPGADLSCGARRDFDVRAAPAALPARPVTRAPLPQPGAAVQASIDYVSFGPHAHLLGPARPGRLLGVRLDVLAATNTFDADLRWDVDGARLLGCWRDDLVPGRVAHLTMALLVPRSAAGTVIGVTVIVQVRAERRGVVLQFRRTYRLPVP